MHLLKIRASVRSVIYDYCLVVVSKGHVNINKYLYQGLNIMKYFGAINRMMNLDDLNRKRSHLDKCNAFCKHIEG